MKTKIVVTTAYEIDLLSDTMDNIIGYLEYEAKELIIEMQHPMQKFRLLNSKTEVEAFIIPKGAQHSNQTKDNNEAPSTLPNSS